MKYLKQFSIILFISFLGEILHTFIPFPIPASVYGLVILLTALCTGILKVGQVKETASILIEIMPVMFIPAAVGLLDSWPSLYPVFIPVILITLITTVLVMAVTGQVTQHMIKHQMFRRKSKRKIDSWRKVK